MSRKVINPGGVDSNGFHAGVEGDEMLAGKDEKPWKSHLTGMQRSKILAHGVASVMPCLRLFIKAA